MTAIIEPTASLFPSSVNMSAETRGQIVELLNRRLADSIDLKHQAKHAHWNVKGQVLFRPTSALRRDRGPLRRTV